MPNFTPQQIVDLLHAADNDLETVAKQFAWFKGQRDWWKDEYELHFAKAKARHDSKYGGNEAATVAVSEELIAVHWMDDVVISLPEMVRLTEASFDVVDKRYKYLETHIMILMSVNKNVMMDYGRA